MARFRIHSNAAGGKPSTASAGCLGLFGLVFAAAGTFFAVAIAMDFSKTVDARSWEQVPASLTAANIEVSRGNNQPFCIRVLFAYDFGGRAYTSDRYALRDACGDDYEDLALKLKALREQVGLSAYVNPDDPAVAILVPGSLASGFAILFPFIFVAVGVGCLIGAIKIVRGARAKDSGSADALSSRPAQKNVGSIVGVVLGGIFTTVGIGVFYSLAIKPFNLSREAKSWVETPCEIIWADVKSHSSDDGTTYSVDIFYAYAFEGEQHHSNRYTFMGGSSSGRDGKKKVVDHYREAKEPVCYVDPGVPERAVLKREIGASGFLALIPVMFILVGGSVLVFSLIHWKGGRGRLAEASTRPPFEPVGAPSPAVRILSPGKGRLAAAAILLLAALIWNGIVFGFLFPEAWFGGGGGFVVKLFSIPFILIGGGLALGFVYSTLAILNPQPILTLEPGEPQLGVPAFLKWHFKGSSGRLRRLRILVRGVERASFTRGTDTVTETKCFYAAVISDETQTLAMHGGAVEFTLPADLMYSFGLANNAILWSIEVKGEITIWPDVSDRHDIVVRPQPKR